MSNIKTFDEPFSTRRKEGFFKSFGWVGWIFLLPSLYSLYLSSTSGISALPSSLLILFAICLFTVSRIPSSSKESLEEVLLQENEASTSLEEISPLSVNKVSRGKYEISYIERGGNVKKIVLNASIAISDDKDCNKITLSTAEDGTIITVPPEYSVKK